VVEEVLVISKTPSRKSPQVSTNKTPKRKADDDGIYLEDFYLEEIPSADEKTEKKSLEKDLEPKPLTRGQSEKELKRIDKEQRQNNAPAESNSTTGNGASQNNKELNVTTENNLTVNESSHTAAGNNMNNTTNVQGNSDSSSSTDSSSSSEDEKKAVDKDSKSRKPEGSKRPGCSEIELKKKSSSQSNTSSSNAKVVNKVHRSNTGGGEK
jgi:hypothetical protein